jgi:hypothetical protein
MASQVGSQPAHSTAQSNPMSDTELNVAHSVLADLTRWLILWPAEKSVLKSFASLVEASSAKDLSFAVSVCHVLAQALSGRNVFFWFVQTKS